jgi:hypothetical protein
MRRLQLRTPNFVVEKFVHPGIVEAECEFGRGIAGVMVSA